MVVTELGSGMLAFKGVRLKKGGLGSEDETLIFNYDDLWDGAIDSDFWTESSGSAGEEYGAIYCDGTATIVTTKDLLTLAKSYGCKRIQFFASIYGQNVRGDYPSGTGGGNGGTIRLTDGGGNTQTLCAGSAQAGQAASGEHNHASAVSQAWFTLKFTDGYENVNITRYGTNYSSENGGTASSSLVADDTDVDVSSWASVKLELIRTVVTIAGASSETSVVVAPLIFLNTPLNYSDGLYVDRGV